MAIGIARRHLRGPHITWCLCTGQRRMQTHSRGLVPFGTAIGRLCRVLMSERHAFIVEFRNCGRKCLDAAIPVLEAQRASAQIDLYEPVADEVVGGLFARVFRFLQTFILDYHLWADDLGRVILRMMLEAVFYLRFLSEQNQPELFLAF